MKTLLHVLAMGLLFCVPVGLRAQALKSIVYDFDGLDIGQTDLPEGDYRVNDLAYQVAATPLGANDMLGDRVLKLDLNWNTSYGAFGRGISRYIEFNSAQDKINFYFYNPYSNNQNANLEVVLADDDNQNLYFDNAGDDTWKKNLVIPGSSGWQLISIALSEFTDMNTGGNGTFDIAFTQNKGMLLFTEFRFTKPGPVGNATFYLDFISFSEGNLPQGATAFDLPPKQSGDYALLGAFVYKTRGNEHQIPGDFEGLFPASNPPKKIKYANWFQHWATNGGTTPHELPGAEVQTLLNNGYRPIITWEPQFQGHDRLSSVQPRLANINNGTYDWYIDQFATKIKSYNDTIVIRFMHEFEGDWYPWSISQNNNDPQAYINAFRRVVTRFRNLGATKVKWMWCVNSDYAPYRHYNWIVPAYPGDDYVDIVATDIYNNHYPEHLPWWRSFRWQTVESYYYLTKYFPRKQLWICEVGCRERFGSENGGSESKGAWYARMDKELQSNFRLVRALVFFHANPDQNWLVNSSSSALQSLTNNVWNDSYYFTQTVTPPPPSSCSGTGSILREVWTNVSGTSVSNIPLTTTPAFSENPTSFQTAANSGDGYGQRLRGYICPPTSGNYIFWMASDDNSELWLSSNDQPGNRTKIASVTGWTFPGEWTKYPSQQSAQIYLTAGQRYYIEALHKEGDQGDHLAVKWQLPGGGQESPIPGSRLIPFTTSLGVSLTSPANNAMYSTGSSVPLSATVSGGTVQSVQFYANTTMIGEDFSAPYDFAWNGAPAGSYQLSAKAVPAGSPAYSNTVSITVSNASSCNSNGTITREVWTNVGGTSVSNIPLQNAPSSVTQLTTLQSPTNEGDNYGQRIRGFICAPLSGSYTFWIASDDNSELWLSTSDQPSGKVKIASVTGWTYPAEWTKYTSQQSAQVSLTAGQRYYIEVLHKEGSQGDNLAVGWQLPGGQQERPIPGTRLSSFSNPLACTITSPPNNSSYQAGTQIVINASASGGNNGIQKVEFFSGATKLGEDATSPYSFTWNLPEGSFTLTAKATDGNNATAVSQPVRISSGAAVCAASIQPGSSTTFCSGGNVTLYSKTGPGYSYQWIVNGSNIPGAVNASYNTSSDGDYQVRISYPGCTAWSAPVKVTVNNSLTSRITPGGPTTFCEGENVTLYGNTCSGYQYQWKRDGSDIPGATSQNYVATTSGSYQLKIVQGSSMNWSALVNVTVNNCMQGGRMAAPAADTTTTIQKTRVENVKLSVYPNPTTGMFTFDFCMEELMEQVLEITVRKTSDGSVVYQKPPVATSGCIKEIIDLPGTLPTGIYLLQIRIGTWVENTKIVLLR